MVVVLFYVLHELAADLDCGRSNAVLVFITRIFQRKMQVAFEDVRNQISNMNSSCKNAWLEWRFYSCLTGGNWIRKIQGNQR
jgi:hypothetical protein